MLVTTDHCDCTQATEFPDGGKPEYYEDETDALSAVYSHRDACSSHAVIHGSYRYTNMQHRYWAVHIGGKHIIGIK